MKVNDILKETPLPISWDKSIYDEKNNFTKRVLYALDRAKKLGGGSARVAFQIEFEGRPTALKVARNNRGMAQNEYEVEILSDGYIQQTGLFIPLIDYDKENSKPTWLQTEFAEKMKLSVFKEHFSDLTPKKLVQVLSYRLQQIDPNNPERENNRQFSSRGEEYAYTLDNELIQNLVSVFVANGNMEYDELFNLSNWGMYKGKPVIIDAGLSVAIFKELY